MKSIVSSLALVGALWFSGTAEAQMIRVNVAPPAARIEVIPVAPSPRHTWIGGHWGWRGNAHYWMPGRYEIAPVGRRWVSAQWVNEGGAYVYRQGYWAPAEQYGQPVYAQPQPQYAQPQPVYAQPPQPQYAQPQPQYAQPEYQQPQPQYAQPVQEVYSPPPQEGMIVQQAPPPPQYEVIPVAPSPQHVWIAGSWGWNGGRYIWNPGRYEFGRAGHMWVGPRWAPYGGGGYRMSPGHWRRY